MQAPISFRPLARSDFPLLQQWLSASHVDAWWHERLDLAGVEAKYAPRIDGAEPTHVFILQHAGRPVGWIQWYLWSDYPEHALQLNTGPASAGIDLAIGEYDMTGLGLGPAAVREFIRQIVFADASPRSLQIPRRKILDRCVLSRRLDSRAQTWFDSWARISDAASCAWMGR